MGPDHPLLEGPGGIPNHSLLEGPMGPDQPLLDGPGGIPPDMTIGAMCAGGGPGNPVVPWPQSGPWDDRPSTNARALGLKSKLGMSM